MKIGYLGAGSWGFCLANLLATNGHDVLLWSSNADLVKQLNETHQHPLYPGKQFNSGLKFTTDLEQVLQHAEMLVESVTSSGIRPVFHQIKNIQVPKCPIVVTSKGIEQNTGFILPEVVVEILGESVKPNVGFLSGPSYAQEVIQGLPTAIVASSFSPDIMLLISETFTNSTFRVYPNADIRGVAFGGGLKNIIAIACGMAEGLGLGNSCKAALITRGLHEIRKLALANGCKADTLNGLSGLGDLCMTCSSLMSRNFRFGSLLAQGNSIEEAQSKIGMVVEGHYTCLSALQLSQEKGIPMPITETVHKILYENMPIRDAVQLLMKRTVKEEHL